MIRVANALSRDNSLVCVAALRLYVTGIFLRYCAVPDDAKHFILKSFAWCEQRLWVFKGECTRLRQILRNFSEQLSWGIILDQLRSCLQVQTCRIPFTLTCPATFNVVVGTHRKTVDCLYSVPGYETIQSLRMWHAPLAAHFHLSFDWFHYLPVASAVQWVLTEAMQTDISEHWQTM